MMHTNLLDVLVLPLPMKCTQIPFESHVDTTHIP